MVKSITNYVFLWVTFEIFNIRMISIFSFCHKLLEKSHNFLSPFSQSGIFCCKRNQCLFSCRVRCNVIFLILFLQLVKSQKINKLMPSLKSSQGDYSLKKRKTGSSWFRWKGKQIPPGDIRSQELKKSAWFVFYHIQYFYYCQHRFITRKPC